jgi:outer membrane protein TolC
VLGSAPARAGTLTLDEVLARVDEAPSVRRAAALEAEAHGEALDAHAVENPQLRVAARNLADPTSPAWAQVGVRVPLGNPLALVPGARAGGVREDGAAHALAAARAEARLALAVAFVDAVGAARVAEAREAATARQEALVTTTADRRDAGFATALDLVRARAGLARAQAAAAEARADADRDRALLLLRIGWTGETPELLAPPAPPMPPSLQAALDAAVREDAELRVLAAVERAEELEATAARSRAAPWIDWVQPTVRLQPTDTRVDLQVGVRLPLWSWGTGEARAAQARARAAEADARLRVDELTALVTEAWFGWQAAEQGAAALEASVDAIEAELRRTDPSLHDAVRAEQARVAVEAAEARRTATVAAWTLAGLIRG